MMGSFTTLTALAALSLVGPCSSSPMKDASKVEITVYYETMCPDCIRYDTQVLYPAYEKLQSIMDIVYVPYGKANTVPRPDGEGFDFFCQHGPDECKGNMIHACALAYVDFPLVSDYLNCMMQNSFAPYLAGETCADVHNIDWNPILKCADGLEGMDLLAKQGVKTHSLDPSLSFVPTLELNGSQDNQDDLRNNLIQTVCEAYSGPKPEACS